ncbi:cell division protein FtsQ/DivIB [Nostocoides vanveenii]|uniref:POTRA domain-containing protein n=1 Tax=Nostocoides vanveenii TaxID=330835 RepID=A0ABN2KSB8_9MICO
MRLGTPETARSDGRVTAFPGGLARSAGRGGRRRLAWLAGALVTALLALWIAFASPIFAVHDVRITGSSELVRSIAKKVTASAVGVPVLRVDTGSLEAQIEADSRVADATVRRGLPRSLVVEVVARLPVLGVEKAKGQVDLVDIQGVVAERVTKAPAGVPVVSSASGQVSPAGVEAALDLLTALPESLRAKVQNLRIDATESMSFRVGATTVTWGGADRAEVKARLVQILLTKKPATIDVSAPDTPTTT